MKGKFVLGVCCTLISSLILLGCGCGMLADKTMEEDSYYSYLGQRPEKEIVSSKYESAQGLMKASSANYAKVITYLDQYLAMTKGKHQYINFIHGNINLPSAMVADKLLSLKKVNPAAFSEICEVFALLRKQLPGNIIAQEYSNACLLKSEIGKLKIGLEADMLSKQQVISDLTYQNMYAANAAGFLNKQYVLANSSEMQEVSKVVQQGK